MNTRILPNQKSVGIAITGIFDLLFPARELNEMSVEGNRMACLNSRFKGLLTGLTVNADSVVSRFNNDLEGIKKNLLKDAYFIHDSDPAATEIAEVIAVYPGFYALFCYRIAHLLLSYCIPLLPRMITEHAHRETGIDIHPGAEIGCPVSIDHGTGIVIGETAWIGNNVKIYQGVTLGALSVVKSKASRKRHPTIEDNVVLYAGCTVLGGNTVIGHHSIIGGNVWLTSGIRPYSVVYNKSDIVVRDQRDLETPVDFII